MAGRETELPAETFPSACPWTYAQAMQPDFMGEEP